MSKATVYAQRRQRLSQLLPDSHVFLVSGCARTRNYKDATYPFRASSHYLYFGGPQEPEYALVIYKGEATLYRQPSTVADEVWMGVGLKDHELMARYGYSAVKTLEDLAKDFSDIGQANIRSVKTSDPASNRWLYLYLGRLPESKDKEDVEMIEALIKCRLCHDPDAQERLRAAAQLSMQGQSAVMLAARPGLTEFTLKGVLDYALAQQGGIPSFQPIISTRGEILHNPYYSGTLEEGDLLLIDAGGEFADDGWSGDLTRVVPVSGKFSKTQRAIYDIVDRARQAGVFGVAPGVHFRELHLKVARVIAQGLVDLGILKGDPKELVELGVHALFFPHGLGHLVGLDVHDLEDLGDRAGYAVGESRSEQFGLSYLRLSRTLEPGMAVTIEPGIYNIPALINGELGKKFDQYLDREVLARYSDVRGIRLEDMVLVTADGGELLSAGLPVGATEIEELLGSWNDALANVS